MAMLHQILAQFIYPPHCTGCGIPGQWLCSKCANTYLIKSPPECWFCRRISAEYRTHNKCTPYTPVRQLTVVWRYNKIARKLMRIIKKRLAYSVIEQLAGLSQNTQTVSFCSNSLLIPVPTTPGHIRTRGFNHTVMLARELSRRNDVPIRDILRKRDTASEQTGKSRKERLLSSPNELYIKGKTDIADRTVMLIDDVCTTGTTLDNCARTLRNAGCGDISAFVLFRGRPNYSRKNELQPARRATRTHTTT